VYYCIFSTRFECIIASSPLVSSVLLHLLHSFRVYYCIFSTRFECIFHIFSTRFECSFSKLCEKEKHSTVSSREASVMVKLTIALVKLHSKRVEKMSNYTRNERRRCETTPETSGKESKVCNTSVVTLIVSLFRTDHVK
jgi:hypothetical protein